jgi:DNA-binding HxlR family transcriptional regulator
MAMHKGDAETCGAMADILNRIGDKWSVMVVGHLARRTLRFNELRTAIGGISQRMLTLSLRNLERDGLVTRTVYPEIPPRVEYRLTELGQTLTGPIDALWEWSAVNRDAVVKARERYDARNKRQAEKTRKYAGAA